MRSGAAWWGRIGAALWLVLVLAAGAWRDVRAGMPGGHAREGSSGPGFVATMRIANQLDRSGVPTGESAGSESAVLDQLQGVVAPILLYHRVVDFPETVRYAVAPAEFERQLRALSAWGYTPIPLTRLLEALEGRATLPERPVVITFDDGYLDVYSNAFPRMERMGFPGVAFVVGGQIGVPGFLDGAQLRALRAAGWEIGNHSMTHADLTLRGADWLTELVLSRRTLLSSGAGYVEVFSYPYGRATPALKEAVEAAGYRAAVGVGGLFTHREAGRFFLSRVEVHGEMDLLDFARILPHAELHAVRGLLDPPDHRIPIE